MRPDRLLLCVVALAAVVSQASVRADPGKSEIASRTSTSRLESAVQIPSGRPEDEDNHDCFFQASLPRDVEDAYLDTLYGTDTQGSASIPGGEVSPGGMEGADSNINSGLNHNATAPVYPASPVSLNTTTSASPALSNRTRTLQQDQQRAGDDNDGHQSHMPAERTYPSQEEKRPNEFTSIDIAAAMFAILPTLKRKRRRSSSETEGADNEQPRRQPRSPDPDLGHETARHEASLQEAVQRAREFQSKSRTQEELVAEVKRIYSRLTRTERTCIEASRILQSNEARPLSRQLRQALITMHRTLLREHHEFFLASQHPSATPALRRLASKYSMPARMWRHGIYSLLEPLRSRLPDSLEHLQAFLRLSYDMVHLLYFTVPSLEGVWMECLGDLSRYRYAIEDDDRGEREAWTQVSRYWYMKASHQAPTTGRLYHHLAIVERDNPIRALYYLTKSVCAPVPFKSSRESFESLFMQRHDGQFSVSPDRIERANDLEKTFFHIHTIMFTQNRLDEFGNALAGFLYQLNAHDTLAENSAWVDNTFHIAIVTCSSLLGYKERGSRLLQSDEDQPSQNSGDEAEDNLAIQHQIDLACAAARHLDERALLNARDSSILTYLHVRLVFMLHMRECQSAGHLLQPYCFPWALAANYLNHLHEPAPSAAESQGGTFPHGKFSGRPLPEDWAMRGLAWADDYFPEGWFAVDGTDFYDVAENNHLPSMQLERKERLVQLGCRLAGLESPLLFDQATQTFSVDQETVTQLQINSGTQGFPSAYHWEAMESAREYGESSSETATDRSSLSTNSGNSEVCDPSKSTPLSSSESSPGSGAAAWDIVQGDTATGPDSVQKRSGVDALEFSPLADHDTIVCVTGRFILPKPGQAQSISSPTTAEAFRIVESSTTASEASPGAVGEGPRAVTSSPAEGAGSLQYPDIIYRCPRCPRTYQRRCDLNKHAVAHTKPVKCTVTGCGQSCSTPRDLERHQNAQHPDQFGRGRKIACDVPGCNRRFARKDHVARHKRNAHGK